MLENVLFYVMLIPDRESDVMSIVQLLYCSKARAEITEDDITAILDVSRKNNSTKEITGALFNNRQFFIQLIEGNYREINDLFQKIVMDERHQKVTLLLYRTSQTRMFGDWAMNYLDESDHINDLLAKYIDKKLTIDMGLFASACINYLDRKTHN